ncbi:MAG: hypothetical protein KGL42_08625 [Betaproteobacteria bacterium]|nr:hypothetical protein [Betaproteobacteria bacterium]
MSTHLDLDDVAAPHPKAAAELATLRAELEALRTALRTAPRAESIAADFDGMTWTFQIDSDCKVSAGIYALLRVTPDDLVQPNFGRAA